MADAFDGTDERDIVRDSDSLETLNQWYERQFPCVTADCDMTAFAEEVANSRCVAHSHITGESVMPLNVGL